MKHIDTSIASINNKMKRVENLSSDFRNTTTQIKNFTRSLFGKTPLADPKKQGILTKSVLKGLKQINKMQDRLQYTIVDAFSKIDDVQKEAKDIQLNKDGKDKKSVSKMLKNYKDQKSTQKHVPNIDVKAINKPER